MKTFLTISVILVSTNALAESHYSRYVDEMNDKVVHMVTVTSENHGKWKYMGKARLVYSCENGKADAYVHFPDFIGSPQSLEMRFDKQKSLKMRQISGTTDNQGILAKGNTPWVMDNMMKSKKVVVRGYSYDYTSDAAYQFKLDDVASNIDRVNTLGGCAKSLKEIASNKKRARAKEVARIESEINNTIRLSQIHRAKYLVKELNLTTPDFTKLSIMELKTYVESLEESHRKLKR